MRTVVLAAPKGGSGKSTLTAALAVRAVEDGNRVAMLDLNDDQGNLGQWWAIRGQPDNPCLFDEPNNLKLDVRALEADGWEWLFIDTPPLNIDLIEMAVLVADVVIVPVRASIFDIGAIRPIVEICEARHKPWAFVLNAFDAKHKGLNQSAINALAPSKHLLETRIGYRVSYITALTSGKSGAEVDKTAAGEISSLWNDILKLAGAEKKGGRNV